MYFYFVYTAVSIINAILLWNALFILLLFETHFSLILLLSLLRVVFTKLALMNLLWFFSVAWRHINLNSFLCLNTLLWPLNHSFALICLTIFYNFYRRRWIFLNILLLSVNWAIIFLFFRFSHSFSMHLLTWTVYIIWSLNFNELNSLIRQAWWSSFNCYVFNIWAICFICIGNRITAYLWCFYHCICSLFLHKTLTLFAWIHFCLLSWTFDSIF